MEKELSSEDIQSRVMRAEKKIDTLCDKVGITEDGSTWVKQTLDPFNDKERKKVGYPDVVTGKSVIQKIPIAFSYTNTSGAAQDVHIFLDSVDTPLSVYENTFATTGNGSRNLIGDAVSGIGTQRRGGLCLRAGAAGADLNQDTGINTGGALGPAALDPAYLAATGARVISKGFEVVNATNKLNVGGAVRCYRATGAVPYQDSTVINLRNSATPLTTMQAAEGRQLQNVPKNVAEVELYTDHTFWEAEKGCMVVAIPSHQTNEPQQMNSVCYVGETSIANPTKRWATVVANGGNYPTIVENANTKSMCSPFYLCGAYFTGVPANTILDIRAFYYVERFVDSTQKDLVILANPSPRYDPLALEMMSKMAMELPCGTPVKNNAIGDWIKTIADVAGAFGVPGMPIVRGAVDMVQAGMKAYNNASQNTGNGKAMLKQLNQTRKFNEKNQKRQGKGKATLSQEQFQSKKNANKQRKKAIAESRAGLASGGSK